MSTKNKLLTVLSEAEQFALYGLPDFDDGQRLDYLSLDEAELALTSRRPSLGAQVYCALQIGYFKAKHAFFRFSWDEVREDCAFILTRYFTSVLDKDGEMAPGVEPVKVPGYHTDYTEGHSDEFRRLIL